MLLLLLSFKINMLVFIFLTRSPFFKRCMVKILLFSFEMGEKETLQILYL